MTAGRCLKGLSQLIPTAKRTFEQSHPRAIFQFPFTAPGAALSSEIRGAERTGPTW